MNAPAVVIRLAIEERLAIQCDAMTDSEARRLADWIEAHPELVALLEHAHAVVEQDRAA